MVLVSMGCAGSNNTTAPASASAAPSGAPIPAAAPESGAGVDAAAKTDEDLRPSTQAIAEGVITTSPELDVMMIRRNIRTRLEGIRGCYRELSTSQPAVNVATVVNVKFTIAPNGSVVATTARELGSTFEVCIAKTFSQMRFASTPARTGNVQVTYPVQFVVARK
ncbi:MAG: hypothetical protein JWO36_2652 [Myxococcales bacterium]|nr:hypothetical protein [Myxococcales bacterium]